MRKRRFQDPQLHPDLARFAGRLSRLQAQRRASPGVWRRDAKRIACLRSLIAGFAMSLIGAIFFTLGQITLFALLYVIGVICSLVGTGFLLGFKKQFKMMLDPVRIYAAG